MKFSLILATKNRSSELEKFLSHLEGQNYRAFELIIVDQNTDHRLAPIISLYEKTLPIKYMRSSPGASKARNAGMQHAQGDIIAFPDDDCWYPVNLLSDLEILFSSNNEIDGITGLVMDERGHKFSRFPSQAGFIQNNNAFEKACLPAIFLRAKVVKLVGQLDENLGPGSPTPWQSGDETDYILRAIQLGCRLFYNPKIIVFHPWKKENVQDRAYEYGAGFGRVLRIHQFPFRRVGYYFLRPFGGIIYALLRWDLLSANYYMNSLRGRWDGWRASHKIK